MSWATFWAIFSQIHPVTLIGGHVFRAHEDETRFRYKNKTHKLAIFVIPETRPFVLQFLFYVERELYVRWLFHMYVNWLTLESSEL
jgi:hypothetical protein